MPRSNVLTQIEKLAHATDYPLQRDYQWLCNVVHPSVGGFLAFALPFMPHPSKTHYFQIVSEGPMTVGKMEDTASSVSFRVGGERTIQEAIARAATFAVEVLEKTLDDALKVIDDIGLTTKAPQMASFKYWRNQIAKRGNASCPCRSGRKAKHCLHRWRDPAPMIVERFDKGGQ